MPETTAIKVTKISFLFLTTTLVVVGWFGLAIPLITVLFSYLALSRLKFFNRPEVSIILFIILVSSIFYGFVFFTTEAIEALPHIAEKSIPIVIDFAKQQGWELPFSDLESLKSLTVETLSTKLRELANFAKIVSKEFAIMIIALVVAISIFVNSKIDLHEGPYAVRDNLYSLATHEISIRFRNLYTSFEVVMGAQIIISAINTIFTAIFVMIAGIPYPKIIIVITFLCGLLPIIGNIISNTIICGIAITVSPTLGIVALIYLVLLHKVEYFLNSKIIGGRIKNPMWLTLLGLLVGESLMGIPGMILAPVVLHYIKHECSQISVKNI